MIDVKMAKAIALADVLRGTMNVKECADFLNCSEDTVYRRIQSGKIKVAVQERPYAVPKLQFFDELIVQKKSNRLLKISNRISRNCQSGLPIKPKWVEEYNLRIANP